MTEVALVPIANISDRYGILFRLLIERPDNVSISHKSIPTFENHRHFVDNHPYKAWYFILNSNKDIVGSIYLTQPPKPSVAGNEIGVFILKKWQRNGYASAAIKLLIQTNGSGIYHANIGPDNNASQLLFEGLGFNLVQFTYRFTA